MNSHPPTPPPYQPPTDSSRGSSTNATPPVSRLRTRIGIVVLFLLLGLGSVARVINARTPQENAVTRSQLPAITALGELRDDDQETASMTLCPPTNPTMMRWPCTGDAQAKAVPPGTRARVMKADVVIDQGLCRLAVEGGPNDRYVGDGPCRFVHVLLK